MIKICKAVTGCAALLALSSIACGDDTQAVVIKLGGTRNYQSSSTLGYYDFAIFGKTLLANGSAPTFTDYASGGLADVTSKPFFVSVQQGQTSVGGSLLQAYNVKPMESFIPGLKDFDIVMGVDAQVASLAQSNYQAGLEYKALTLPLGKIGGVSWAESFVKFGAVGQHHVGTGNVQSTDGRLTARGAVALAAFCFGKPSVEYKPFADSKLAQTLDVKGMELLKAYRKENHKTDGFSYNGRTLTTDDLAQVSEMLVKFDLLSEEHKSATWDQERSAKMPFPAGVPDVVLWADGNLDYGVTGTDPAAKLRSVYSINLKLNLKGSSSYFQVQYVNGFTSAEPNKRANTVAAFLGYSF